MPAKTPVINRVLKLLFGRMLRQHLRRPPRRMIKQPFALSEITDDDTRIFNTVHARSPANVLALKKKHGVHSADELIPLLDDNHYHIDPRERLRQLIMRATGERDHDTTISAVVGDLKRQRRVPSNNVLGQSKWKGSSE